MEVGTLHPTTRYRLNELRLRWLGASSRTDEPGVCYIVEVTELEADADGEASDGESPDLARGGDHRYGVTLSIVDGVRGPELVHYAEGGDVWELVRSAKSAAIGPIESWVAQQRELRLVA
jgi:hypothetical protein